MRGASGESLAAARERLEEVAGRADARANDLADELFAFLDALEEVPALGRVLGNPNHSPAARTTLVGRVMAGRDAGARDLAEFVVTRRWTGSADLPDAVERLAVDARLIAIAGRAGGIERFVDELFEAERFLVAQRDIRSALADRQATPPARAKLVRALFKDKIAPSTTGLIERVVAHPRGRTLSASILFLARAADARRGRVVARVTSARALTEAQTLRLGEIIEAAYRRPAHLNITIDPTVLGGLRVRVGDDVVDATLLARLAAMREAVAA
jgi:F-type H+-transporting ATPase subunit delta